MFKSNYELIIEACKAEKNAYANWDCDSTKVQFTSVYDDIMDMEVGVAFTPAMVPVIKSAFTEEFYVDAADVARLATENDATMEEAFMAIAAENALDPNTMCIMIESEDEVAEMIAEAKNDPKKLGVINQGLKKLEELKKKKINLKKKKSKKK